MATCESISTFLSNSTIEEEYQARGKSFRLLERLEFNSRETFSQDSINRQSDDDLIGEVHSTAEVVIPVPGRRRMSLMDKMTIPLKFRASRGFNRCRNSLSKITRKVVQADKTWIGFMVGMSTIDVILNLTNFVMMSKENLNFGLVIGPPSKELWYVLLAFTILSWLLYVPESMNTIFVLFSPVRQTYIPIPYEMIVTLLLKHIPLSTIVYFVGRCRREFTTTLESVCNAFRITHILMRLIWHAHMEGRKLKKDDKHSGQKIIVLICCLLYGISTSFAIKNWRNEPGRDLKRYHLINVSIIMLNDDYIDEKPFPPERLFFSLEIGELIKSQGYSVDKPWLIRSLLPIKERGSLTTDYSCVKRFDEIRPLECGRYTQFLRFKFKFLQASTEFPYGEISYNYAQMFPKTSTKGLANSSAESFQANQAQLFCIQAKEHFRGRWKLYFLEIKRSYSNFTYSDSISVKASAPFRKSWTHPRPRFNPDIDLCVNETKPYEYEPSHSGTPSKKTSYFSILWH